MKIIISSLLAAALMVQVAQAADSQTNNVTGGHADLWPCLLVVSCAGAASAIIIYVCKKFDGSCGEGKHRLALEGDHMDGIWERIATNTVYISTNRLEVFRDYTTDPCRRYRVIELPLTE